MLLRRYYLRRLFDPGFWRGMLVGGVDLRRALGGVCAAFRDARAGEQQRGLSAAHTDSSPPSRTLLPVDARLRDALIRYEGPVFLALSGNDMTANEFRQFARDQRGLRRRLRRSDVTDCLLPDADHTLSQRDCQESFERKLLAWLERMV
jgi:hypothetical protein